MAIFDNEQEQQRKVNLKALEDKRLAFAEKMAAIGFKPDRMLFCSDEVGSFAALARHEGKYALVVGATYGKDDDYRLELYDEPACEREDIYEKGTGLNGIFGFGTKPASGFILRFPLSDGTTAEFRFLAGRTTAMEVKDYKKNPLLSLKRRRHDANVVWEFIPVDGKMTERAEKALAEHYLA